MSKNRKTKDAAIYAAVKVEDLPEIGIKFFYKVASSQQELFDTSDEAPSYNQEAESSNSQ